MVYLSLQGARLVALLINALYGVTDYITVEPSPSVDLLFALRVIQGEVDRLHDMMVTRGYPSDLVEQLRDLSQTSFRIFSAVKRKTEDQSPIQYKKFGRLLNSSFGFAHTSFRRVDARVVWESRTTFSTNLTDEQSNRCLSELFADDGNCLPTNDCLDAMIRTKNLANYALSKQIIYYALATRNKLCLRSLNKYFQSNRTAMENHMVEMCSNTIHEMDLFLTRVTADLHSLTGLQKDLLMQHVFVCGHLGFVDVARPSLLWMILKHQKKDGCFALKNSDSLPEIGRRLLSDEEVCSPHSTTVATGSLMVFLSFVLSPSKWVDFHLIDETMASAEQFTQHQFIVLNWRNWTDREGGDAPMGEPPSFSHVRTDFFAFILLFIGLVAFIVLTQHYCGRPAKQFYGYSYKKL